MKLYTQLMKIEKKREVKIIGQINTFWFHTGAVEILKNYSFFFLLSSIILGNHLFLCSVGTCKVLG